MGILNILENSSSRLRTFVYRKRERKRAQRHFAPCHHMTAPLSRAAKAPRLLSNVQQRACCAFGATPPLRRDGRNGERRRYCLFNKLFRGISRFTNVPTASQNTSHCGVGACGSSEALVKCDLTALGRVELPGGGVVYTPSKDHT